LQRCAAAQVRFMLKTQQLPPPLQGETAAQRCKGCSLHERCQPEVASSADLARLRQRLFEPDD
jgi:CRISPR-associated exonuclease Cas4